MKFNKQLWGLVYFENGKVERCPNFSSTRAPECLNILVREPESVGVTQRRRFSDADRNDRPRDAKVFVAVGVEKFQSWSVL